MAEWRFYVYALTDPLGVVRYVGKGSGDRLKNQKRNHRLSGHEVARFKRESDAYAFERRYIAEMRPDLNKDAGGCGSRVTPLPKARRYRFKWDTDYQRGVKELGPRRAAAKFLLSLDREAVERVCPGFKLDVFRLQAVLDGPRC